MVAEYGEFLANLDVDAVLLHPGQRPDRREHRRRARPGSSGTAGRPCSRRSTRSRPSRRRVDAPFRMPVQGVYKFTADGDDRRIVAGTVAAGRVRVGDELVFLPSGKKSAVTTHRGLQPAGTRRRPRPAKRPGFTLADQIYVARGELAVRADQTSRSRLDAAARQRVLAGTRSAGAARRTTC